VGRRGRAGCRYITSESTASLRSCRPPVAEEQHCRHQLLVESCPDRPNRPRSRRRQVSTSIRSVEFQMIGDVGAIVGPLLAGLVVEVWGPLPALPPGRGRWPFVCPAASCASTVTYGQLLAFRAAARYRLDHVHRVGGGAADPGGRGLPPCPPRPPPGASPLASIWQHRKNVHPCTWPAPPTTGRDRLTRCEARGRRGSTGRVGTPVPGPVGSLSARMGAAAARRRPLTAADRRGDRLEAARSAG
jgi:hypothetical protein